MKLTDAASRLEALGNPTRLRIYRTLVRAGQSGMPVGRLQEKLKVAPSTLSHHVKSLVGITVDVCVKSPGEIPRSQGKAVRVRDLRPKET